MYSLPQWSGLKPQAVLVMLADDAEGLAWVDGQAVSGVEDGLHPMVSPLQSPHRERKTQLACWLVWLVEELGCVQNFH